MVLLTDIIHHFITTELLPKIVAKTLELSEKNMDCNDIVKEISGMDSLFDVTKASVKRTSTADGTRSKSTAAPVPKAETLDDYVDKGLKDEPVCIYYYVRGANKEKVCCKPIPLKSFNKDDRKLQRCDTHKDSAPGPDIDVMLAKAKTPSKSDQVAKMRKTLPKGTPDGITTSPAPTVSSVESKMKESLGKVSIKDQLKQEALKIENATPSKSTPSKTPPKAEPTPEPVAEVQSDAKLNVKPKPVAKPLLPKPKLSSLKTATPEPAAVPESRDPTPDRERTPVKEAKTPESQTAVAPPEVESTPSREVTPSDSSRPAEDDEAEPQQLAPAEEVKTTDVDHVIPVDENGDQYFLTPSQPSAQSYLWMMYSDNQIMVFNQEFENCYGVYTTDAKIDPKNDLKISSAWKRLLRPASDAQKAFVEERGINIQTL